VDEIHQGQIMALMHSDFRLTDEQLARINSYSARSGAAYAEEGEGPAISGLKVEFTWTPGFGRSVTAFYDGAVEGCPIESIFD
jgi:hypothetical protein